MLNCRLVQGGPCHFVITTWISANKFQLSWKICIISCKFSSGLKTKIQKNKTVTLAKYRPFKSIQHNLLTEAIRPQRDLKPFISPLMTRQCQHAEFIRWEGHLHHHVLSITFQRVTPIFAPSSPQGHFVSSCQMDFCHSTYFIFSHQKVDCGPSFVIVQDGTCLMTHWAP